MLDMLNLRYKYPILSFLTEGEFNNLMSVVQSVSTATSVSVEDILNVLTQGTDNQIGKA